MKQYLAALLVIFLFILPLAVAEEADYGFYLPEGCSIQSIPAVDHTLLTDDPDELLVMAAIHDWYLTDYDRAQYVEARELALFVTPFIFDTHEADGMKEIWCVCTIDEYALVKSADGEMHFRSGYSTYQAFDLLYGKRVDGWTIEEIRIPSVGEELVPGWGQGTQGMNGVTDAMIDMMSQAQYDQRAEQFVRRYMEAAGLAVVEIIDPD
ncbi:MAG: hypothetical protein IKK21_01195 [Clostridia bacterium]|nr:hypothetical protein [Clostridia bacterium]